VATPLLLNAAMARAGTVLGLLTMTLLTGCAVARPVSTAPAPAALPAVVAAPSQRTLAYPHGEWILYGNGTTRAPYVWVWVPAGTTPPRR
jgi:hypothetical protein